MENAQVYFGLPHDVWLVLAGATSGLLTAILGVVGNYWLTNLSAKNERKRLLFEKRTKLFSDYCTYCSKIFGAPRPGKYGPPVLPTNKLTGPNDDFHDNYNEWKAKLDNAMHENQKEFEEMINITIFAIHEFSYVLFELELFLPSKKDELRELQRFLIELSAIWETIKIGGSEDNEQQDRRMEFLSKTREKFIVFRDFLIDLNLTTI